MRLYEDVTGRKKFSVLPPDLQRSIARLCACFSSGHVDEYELATVVFSLAAMPAEAYLQAAREIVSIGGLYHYVPERSFLRIDPSEPDNDPVSRVPGLEYFCLFHGNGFLREKALSKIDGPLESEFYFNSIAYRLNDWVEPVRQAAKVCASRVFPQTSATIIAKAASVLLVRMPHWQRGQETSILEETLARPDVVDELATLIKTAKTGSPNRVLTYALKRENMDPYLLDLSRTARQPTVRALALRTLIQGYAVWQEGFHREWIDKSMGQFRRAPTYHQRELRFKEPLEPLVIQGAADKSAMVRRVAADGLVQHRHAFTNLGELVSIFVCDKSPSVRARAEFIIRDGAEK